MSRYSDDEVTWEVRLMVTCIVVFYTIAGVFLVRECWPLVKDIWRSYFPEEKKIKIVQVLHLLNCEMEIHSDYIIYFINFVIYVVLCVMVIKQAKKDIFAPKKKEEPVMCPTHGCPLDIPQTYKEHMYIRRS
ncbi:hypothetical protein ACROYT_G002409 [Oculina patagonica]